MVATQVTTGGWKFHAEGFGPGYGTASDFVDEPPDGVEPAEDGDRHVTPPPPDRPRPIAFVDGTRRVEQRLWATHTDGQRHPGLAGAYAVGATTAQPGRPMVFQGVRVGRILVWGGGLATDLAGRTLKWDAVPVATTDPALLLDTLQDAMRRAEGDLALDLAGLGWNVVLDGPLNRIRSLDRLVTGYVKTHHRRMLPADHHDRLPSLGVGQRTTLWSAGADRYTCYVRVGPPGPLADPLAGVARLDFPAAGGIDHVRARADLLAAVLPRYASAHHADPRAPVNLAPVANLEHHLARTLGNTTAAGREATDALLRLRGTR